MGLRRATNANRRGGLSGAGAVWTPASLSGLVAWFDFSDTDTLTLASAPKVSAVADKGPNGYSLIQPTAATQPEVSVATLNGRTGLDFRPTVVGRALYTTTGIPAALSGLADITVVSVWSLKDLTLNSQNWRYDGTTPAYSATRTVPQLRYVNSVAKTFEPLTTAAGVYVQRCSSSVAPTARFNGSALTPGGSDPGALPTGPVQYIIGAGTTAGIEPHNGVIWEHAIYNRRLTDDEVLQVEGYLRPKYGL